MIDQAITEGNRFSIEQHQDRLVSCWTRLAHIRLMLEDEHNQDMTAASIANAKTCIYEIVKIVSVLPSHFVLTSIVSRDALLTYLQKASFELGFVYDQLLAKRKTRRYYSALLLCQQHICKALEQKIWHDRLQQGFLWRMLSSIRGKNDLYSQSNDVSIYQGRQYQIELPAALEALECLLTLFQEDQEIWPDQCTRASTILYDIQTLIQAICRFLDALACSPAAISSCYCQTIVIFHNIHEQLPKTVAIVDHYRAICKSSALRSVNTKHLISEALTSISQHTDEGMSSFTKLLDLASFQERRASDEYTQLHFA